jgi:hypothetical protein
MWIFEPTSVCVRKKRGERRIMEKRKKNGKEKGERNE